MFVLNCWPIDCPWWWIWVARSETIRSSVRRHCRWNYYSILDSALFMIQLDCLKIAQVYHFGVSKLNILGRSSRFYSRCSISIPEKNGLDCSKSEQSRHCLVSFRQKQELNNFQRTTSNYYWSNLCAKNDETDTVFLGVAKNSLFRRFLCLAKMPYVLVVLRQTTFTI